MWPKLRWGLLALAILYQCIIAYYRGPLLEADQGFQISAGRSFLNGDGLTNSYANTPGDLSITQHIPVLGWPPGYSLLISPFLALFDDVWWAALVVEWLSIVLFFVAWFVISESLGEFIGIRARLFLWFYWALIDAPVAASTDQTALAFFSANLALCLWMITRDKSPIRFGILSGLCAGASGAIRYAYWPLLIATPLSLGLYALVKPKRRLILGAVIHTITAGVGVFVLMLYNQINSGHLSYISQYYPDGKAGYFWNNLTLLYPFPTTAFGLDRTLSYLGDRLHFPQSFTTANLWFVSLIILATFVMAGIMAVKLERAARREADERGGILFFYVTGALTTCLVVASLVYLSVRYASNSLGWTYVQESRYYAPCFGFLSVSLATVAFGPSLVSAGRLFKIYRWVVVGVLVLAICLVGPFRAAGLRYEVSRALSTGEAGIQYEIFRSVKQARQEGLPVVFITDPLIWDNSKIAAAVLLAGGRYYRGVLPPAVPFATTQSVTVIVGVPHDDASTNNVIEYLAAFHRQHAGVPVGSLYHMDLFQLTLLPSEAGS